MLRNQIRRVASTETRTIIQHYLTPDRDTNLQIERTMSMSIKMPQHLLPHKQEDIVVSFSDLDPLKKETPKKKEKSKKSKEKKKSKNKDGSDHSRRRPNMPSPFREDSEEFKNMKQAKKLQFSNEALDVFIIPDCDYADSPDPTESTLLMDDSISSELTDLTFGSKDSKKGKKKKEKKEKADGDKKEKKKEKKAKAEKKLGDKKEKKKTKKAKTDKKLLTEKKRLKKEKAAKKLEEKKEKKKKAKKPKSDAKLTETKEERKEKKKKAKKPKSDTKLMEMKEEKKEKKKGKKAKSMKDLGELTTKCFKIGLPSIKETNSPVTSRTERTVILDDLSLDLMTELEKPKKKLDKMSKAEKKIMRPAPGQRFVEFQKSGDDELSGLELEIKGNFVFVKNVQAPAPSKNLHPKDRIIALNGKKIEDYKKDLTAINSTLESGNPIRLVIDPTALR